MRAKQQRLYINIDHVATLRQARRGAETDPVEAASVCEAAGADGITAHLREDRRHIQDEDVRRLRDLTHIKLNLEMAATDEMVAIARAIKPEMAMLVPEGRLEVTTEGGLDIVKQEKRLKAVVAKLADAGIVTSVFIDAEAAQVEAAARIGARVCEIHTGPYAHAFHSKGRDAEAKPVLEEIAKVAVHAGEEEQSRLVKLCTNLYLGMMVQALVEVTSLAEKGGTDHSPASASTTSVWLRKSSVGPSPVPRMRATRLARSGTRA